MSGSRLSPAEAEEAALDWLIRLREAPDDAGLRDAHRRWLDADSRHPEAWVKARRGREALGAREAWSARAPRRSTRRLRRGLGGMVAATLLLLAVYLAPGLWLHLRADYATGAGEIRQVTLADGSHVTLAGRSAIDLAFTEGQRNLTLLEGAAYFEVAHDPARPFIVTSGALHARAVGTAFEMSEAGGAAVVSVTEGRVGLSGVPAVAAGTTLEAGQWGRLAEDGALSRGADDPALFASWRARELFVEDRPATEVADLLRRELGGRVLLPGAARDRRVTGFFDLSDPEGALDTFAGSLGFSVLRLGPLRLLRDTAGK